MTGIERELSAVEVRRLASPGLHRVGGVTGLYLRVSPSGGKSWILRATVGSRRRDIGLGGYPTVTLAAARESAREARELIRQGIDPVEQRAAARRALIEAQSKDRTFYQCAIATHQAIAPEFRNEKHSNDWINSLTRYVFPHIGNIPVGDIETNHVTRVLEPIWQTRTETATRIRQRIETVLNHATTKGYRSGENPARWKGHLDTVLPQPSRIRKVRHHRALPVDEMGAFMADLRKREGMGAKALEFLILTAARSGEVRGATWDEIDLKARLWIVPAERMKAGKEHRVPLSDAAVELLEALPRREDSPYVFPAVRGGMLSDMTLSALMRRMKADAVPHGFRSTFRDWCAERTNYPSAVAEMALAHTIDNKVEAAYRRGDLLERRQRLMADWAKFCNTIQTSGDVVPIRGAK